MTDHQWQELVAPYALAVLGREERAGFEAHLAECATCRAEVQAFREVGVDRSSRGSPPPPRCYSL